MKFRLNETTEKELQIDSISQINLDILDLIKRLTYQKSNVSTDAQESAITEAIIFLRKAYNRIK